MSNSLPTYIPMVRRNSKISNYNHQPRLDRMRHSDWLLLSSINPEYDNPNEQFDGITLPGKLKDWFVKAGFGTVVDYTNLAFNKGLDTLLQAQNDYRSGHSICLFVDANIFVPYSDKTGRSLFPNHWVVMNSDIQIRIFNERTSSLASPIIINQSITKTVQQQISAQNTQSILEGNFNSSQETDDRILLDAFSWGKRHVPVSSRISATQDARLSYFLSGFYGYIKVKR